MGYSIDIFIRVQCVHKNVVMMFIHLYVNLSVCPSATGMRCDHMVHFIVDLSLWLNSTML